MNERLEQVPADVDEITADVDELTFDPNEDIEQDDRDPPLPLDVERLESTD